MHRIIRLRLVESSYLLCRLASRARVHDLILLLRLPLDLSWSLLHAWLVLRHRALNLILGLRLYILILKCRILHLELVGRSQRHSLHTRRRGISRGGSHGARARSRHIALRLRIRNVLLHLRRRRLDSLLVLLHCI